MEGGTLKTKERKDYYWIFYLEFIGSAIMLFGIMMSPGNIPSTVAAIFVVGVLYGKYTGAHYNGGLSIAIYIVEAKWKEKLKLLGLYWIAEYTGALFGIAIAYSVAGYDNISFLKPGSTAYSGFYVAYVEMIGTFIMFNMILYVKF